MTPRAHMIPDRTIETTTRKLLAYCKGNDWAGYDPYDALNSRLFTVLPWLDRKVPRLIMTQALKRSPISLRRLLGIPKTQNPKALALFLSALRKLQTIGWLEESEQGLIPFMVETLAALRSQGVPYWCWGYSFPWQTRTIVVPRGVPNLVCTTFVASALLDFYEDGGPASLLEMAVSSVEYIRKELYWEEGDSRGFSYPLPNLRSRTHNANLLAAALFCRVWRHTGDESLLVPALKVARYSASKQQEDGSWFYGEGKSQLWIDNFHTGYNLSALKTIGETLKTEEFETHIRRAFEFYRAHFFRQDGAPRYFHDRTYPIDIHCVAQSILSLLEFEDLHSGNAALAHRVFDFAVKHMWDERGFFYYRVLRACKIRTSYMRWSQAWMLLALATLASASSSVERPEASECQQPLMQGARRR